MLFHYRYLQSKLALQVDMKAKPMLMNTELPAESFRHLDDFSPEWAGEVVCGVKPSVGTVYSQRT